MTFNPSVEFLKHATVYCINMAEQSWGAEKIAWLELAARWQDVNQPGLEGQHHPAEIRNSVG